MNHAELAIVSDGHVDDDTQAPKMFGLNSDGKIGPREFRFESEDGSHFSILEGQRYTVQYTGEPLKTDRGLVKKVQGHAFRDQEGHLILTESTVMYHEKFDRKKPNATTFVMGYIPGIQIDYDGIVVFEWTIDKPRITPLIDTLWKTTPINLPAGIKTKFPNSSQYPTT